VSQINVPEDLSSLSDDELSDLSDSIKETATGLAESAASSDEDLVEVERLVGEYDRIDNELGARVAAQADREQRAASALSRFEQPAEATDPEAAEPNPESPEAAAPEAAATAPAVTAAAEPAAPEAPAPEATASVEPAAAPPAAELPAPVVPEAAVAPTPVTPAPAEVAATAPEAPAPEAVTPEPAPEAPAPEATAAAAAPEAPAPEAPDAAALAVEAPAAAPAEGEPTPTPESQETLGNEAPSEATVSDIAPTPSNAVAALTEQRPAASAPRETSKASQRPSIASMTAADDGASTLDFAGLADSITKRRLQISSVPRGVHDRIVLATGKLDFPTEQRLGQSEFENFGVFTHLQNETQALVASGGNCAPLSPSYEFFRLAEPMSPVEDALPVAEAPRGGIRFIVPPDFRDASAGVRFTTEEEDAAGYTSQDPAGTTDPKPCVAVECPDVVEARVDAISQCVTFGNLNYRVFPEQVQSFLKDLSVIFAETKEVFYLDGIDAGSTAVVSTPPYGAARGIVNDLLRASIAYRKRNHMPIDSPLDVLIPDWTLGLIKVDMVNDHSMGLSFLGATMEQVRAEIFSSLRLNVTFYYDSATGDGQAFDTAQAAGPLNPWPTEVVSYMYSPGTWVRLDVGELNLGIVRDSILNGTNDLQIFSEQWVQVVKVGIESLRIEHTLCPDGTAPEPATALICGS